MIISSVANGATRLTPRESEILELVATGRSARQIAAAVGLAARTVERYIENIRYKMGARNRTHLVALAIARGDLEVRSVGNG
ncbi:response regulator transcription factor [Sphingomicrobium astaxanthinifaciens]|uniref:response regulator transcription factor n=1 Tax=Sphingomicrobium astaxanthinifaciens TaxID=1227949 RepID=UPI001FCC2BFA|nr:helix-turn-helix transcriptional regulator [Sphingomicrobium astaxanthinifaciens]MCJ7421196.1 helix-turn-helix transcriptional regulator [Sphingomicrobium astaxanthinifaciens]